MMTIVLAALGEGIGILGSGTEETGLLPVPGDALAAEIGKVGREVAAAQVHTNDTRLDHRAA
jgi:hypothetical protein